MVYLLMVSECIDVSNSKSIECHIIYTVKEYITKQFK